LTAEGCRPKRSEVWHPGSLRLIVQRLANEANPPPIYGNGSVPTFP
jgi:hypothetical protein